MSLKSLISLKFVLYITGVTTLYFLTYETSTSYDELIQQNERLQNKVELYERLHTMDYSAEGKAKVLETINLVYSTDSVDIIDVKSFNTHLTYLTIFLIVWFGVFSYLNDKIEKKKFATNDMGELL